MLSPTLEAEFKRYAIGEKVRRLRLKKSMGLVELGRHSNISPAMLSKIERGRLVPTLPTLVRIALVFGVDLDHFFTERSRVAIVRKLERQRFPEDPAGKHVSYHFESLDFRAAERKISAYYAEFESVPAAQAKSHRHDGIEFLYVLGGTLAVRIAEEEHLLEEGDTIYFDSSEPHSYRRVGKPACRAITVTAA